jgi:cytidylate kinase
MTDQLIVAIDGPSGVGKGTIARQVAARLGYRYVDTGAMYRAVAWAAVHDGTALDAEDRVADVARSADIEVSDTRTGIDGHDVTRAIRTPEIDRAASLVARLPRVRAILVERQRALGVGGGIVMEGRDIGTVVFPDADVKIYLDAAPEERARRRASDPAHAGNGTVPLAAVATELEARDRADKTRQSSPLMPAEDAHVIDTTGMSIDQVTARVLEIVAARQSDR